MRFISLLQQVFIFLLQCVTSLKVNNCVCADKRNPFLRQALPVKSVEPGGKSNELVNEFKRFYFPQYVQTHTNTNVTNTMWKAAREAL